MMLWFDIFNNIDKIQEVNSRVLIIHRNDNVVSSHMILVLEPMLHCQEEDMCGLLIWIKVAEEESEGCENILIHLVISVVCPSNC
nr:protein ABHD17C-like [Ipomoea batatas]GMC74653.1 protein ABHD17C-like [Ipomoea batatas]GMC76630.1 protein ABHD17C-like [Ipomoea batatas]